MAELVVDGTELVLVLRRWERFWSFHGDVRVPLSSVRRLRIPASPWITLRGGWRATGVAIPGWVAMGTRRHGGGRDFSFVRNHVPSLIVELNGQEFGELTVSVPDPVGLGATIAAAAGIGFDPTPEPGALG